MKFRPCHVPTNWYSKHGQLLLLVQTSLTTTTVAKFNPTNAVTAACGTWPVAKAQRCILGL